MKRTLWALLSVLGLTLIGLTPTPALAAPDWIANTCVGMPARVNNVDVSGIDCTVAYPVIADGYFKVHVIGPITLNNVTAKGNIDLEANTSITTNNLGTQNQGSSIRIVENAFPQDIVLKAVQTTGGNIYISSMRYLQISAVSTALNGAKGGVIDLKAFQNATFFPAPFVIGGTGNPNGINGNITLAGHGGDQTHYSGAVYVTNGPPGGDTGGIQVKSPSNLLLTSGDGVKNVVLILNAQNGALLMKGGTYNLSGTGAIGGGQILLMAKTVDFDATSTLTTSQASTAGGFDHQIIVSAETVTYTGNLTIKSDGLGLAALPATVVLYSQNALSINDGDGSNASSLVINTSLSGNNLSALNVHGSGNLTMTANGDWAQAELQGYPIDVTGAAVTLQSNGKDNHYIYVYNGGNTGGSNGLTFGGTGKVILDANAAPGTGTKGGTLIVDVNNAILNADVDFKASGPATGNGDGGTATITANSVTLSSTKKVSIAADAAAAGSGNAVLGDPGVLAFAPPPMAIVFKPGNTNLVIGTDNGQFSLSARGGSTSGSGGTIFVQPTVGQTFSLQTAGALDASARNGNGDGGYIYLSDEVIAIDPNAKAQAIGKGNGKGGRFETNHHQMDIDILQLVSVDGGDGAGPTVKYGEIYLNGRGCRQFKLSSSWPKTYWVCTDTKDDEPRKPKDVAPSQIALDAAFASLQGKFGDATHQVSIFVFAKPSEFNTFFWEVLDPTAGGLTFRIPSNSKYIYANIMQEGSKGLDETLPYSSDEMKEVTGHELGHAIDIIFGVTSDSTSAQYKAWVNQDLNTLDFADTANLVKRLPCSKTPINPNDLSKGYYPGQIPFANVPDRLHANIPMCANGNLNNNWDPDSFNSGVMQLLEASLLNVYFPNNNPPIDRRWIELHAQVFGFSTAGSLGARPVMGAVLQNGYFPCARAWAAAEKAGANLPAGACAVNPTP